MALTLEQELALLALLSEKKTTLSELPAATGLGADDLMLTRQGIIDKSITGDVLKRYVTPPEASLTTSGIVQLNSDIDSRDETMAATPKAVKGAYDKAVEAISIAHERVSSVNGKEGEVTLTAADVDSVSATNGGQFQLPIAARYPGPFDWANQFGYRAPFFNEFIAESREEYHPLIKQASVNPGHSQWAVSLGTLIHDAVTSFHVHFRGSDGHDTNYSFSTDGVFRAPNGVGAGPSGYLAGDGNLNGTVWGGWLSEWLHNNVVTSVRLGAPAWHQTWNGYGIGDIPGHVLTAAENGNKDAYIDRVCNRPLQIWIGRTGWITVSSI